MRKSYIYGKEIIIYSFMMLLFIGQGIMGWYMVKSGLISSPDVSHYRLAAHLMLAVALYSLLFWQLMRNYFGVILISNNKGIRTANFLLILCLIAAYCQIFLGALVAGLDAGLICNNFPYMGETLIPLEVSENNITFESFNDPIFIQLIHRLMAFILSFLVIITCLYLYSLSNIKLSRVAFFMLIALIIQFIMGVITLLYMVPLIAALIHQLGAIVLLSMILWAFFLIKNT